MAEKTVPVGVFYVNEQNANVIDTTECLLCRSKWKSGLDRMTARIVFSSHLIADHAQRGLLPPDLTSMPFAIRGLTLSNPIAGATEVHVPQSIRDQLT